MLPSEISSSLACANNFANLGLSGVQNGHYKEALSNYQLAGDMYRKVKLEYQGSEEVTELIEITLKLLGNELGVMMDVCQDNEDSVSRVSKKIENQERCFALEGSGERRSNFEEDEKLLTAADAHSVSSTTSSDKGQDFQRYFENLAKCPPGRGFEDVIGHAKIKSLLVSTLFMHPESTYHYLVSSEDKSPNILLFGPPGTGKTKLAEAYAVESRLSTFIAITPSDVMSKWVGESENRLKSLLTVAQKLAPTIIFLDEVDGLLGGERDGKHSSNFINEFLIRIENLENVQVLAATNLPWRLHSSILRRFQYIIHVPLPTFAVRIEILKRLLGSHVSDFTNDELRSLGGLCDKYSPADLSRVIKFAKLLPSLIVQSCEYFKTVTDMGQEKYTPCSSLDPCAIKSRLKNVPHDSIAPPSINYALVRHAVRSIKCSGDLQNLKCDSSSKYNEFYRKYGSNLDVYPEVFLSRESHNSDKPTPDTCVLS